MPALENVRWERFCQAIACGVAKRGQPNTQGQKYIASGYSANGIGQPGGSAEVNASRLLKKAQIEERIAELLREAQDKLAKKRRYDIETISERMALASQIAEETRNPTALYGAEKAIAEVRGLIVKNSNNGSGHVDFKQARSMQDMGRMLLQSVGLAEPDDASIKRAMQLNDTFVAGLELIRDEQQRSQGLEIEHE